jgi:hypothetical protein
VAVIFNRWTNLLPTLVLVLVGPAATAGGLAGLYFWMFSPKWTDVGYAPKQPVPFSHQLHAGDLGMDCRYCHDTVERAAHAAIPPTQTCMNCHAVVKKDSALLEPVRTSWETGEPIRWKNVHLLPDYAYFNHSAHLAAGVGCRSCHGQIDEMPEVFQQEMLSMRWCLSCHRDPVPHLRPAGEVTNMAWDAAASGYDPLADPMRERLPEPPTNCSGCHR